MINMKNFHRAAFVSTPVLLLLSLVYMSGGSDATTVSTMQMPSSTIAGFGFFEEQIFLIAMVFLLGLMTMSSFSENRSRACAKK
jgi:hypothetical protein